MYLLRVLIFFQLKIFIFSTQHSELDVDFRARKKYFRLIKKFNTVDLLNLFCIQIFAQFVLIHQNANFSQQSNK